ncbi:MAG: hypothetical protein V1857_07195 [archaeon]
MTRSCLRNRTAVSTMTGVVMLCSIATILSTVVLYWAMESQEDMQSAHNRDYDYRKEAKAIESI